MSGCYADKKTKHFEFMGPIGAYASSGARLV